VVNVGLRNSRIHAKLVAIFQAEIHGRIHHQLIDGFHRLRSQPMKGAVKRMVFGHRLAIEFREPRSVYPSAMRSRSSR